MKAYVIYDETGSIYAIRYGENQNIPKLLQGIYQEVPEGALVDRVDNSDPTSPKILFTPSKESSLEKEVIELKAQLAYLQMISGVETEVVHE